MAVKVFVFVLDIIQMRGFNLLLLYFNLLLCLSLPGLAQIQTISVKPSVTNNRIKTFDEDNHLVFYHNGKNKKGILIYLPASSHLTSSAKLFCNVAAEAGYIVFALAYAGTDILYDACAHNTMLTCFEDIHREIVEGKNYNPFLNIDSTEGILFRLKALLDYLRLNDKNVNWQDFVDENNNVKFQGTTWVGHSDAAGHAAVMAKYTKVKRVVLFSGPKDFSEHFFVPPPWLNAGTWKTDKNTIFAFSHGQDEIVIQQEIWDSLGLKNYGKTVNMSQVDFPFNNSHQLITSENVPVGHRHYCTVVDGKTPISDGKPIFENVWKYLLDLPSLSTPINLISESTAPKIYPNPVKAGARLNIDIKADTQYTLVSLTGRIVHSGKHSQINTTGMVPGVYLLKLKSDWNHETVQKLIID